MQYVLLVLALAWVVPKIGWMGLILAVVGLLHAVIRYLARDESPRSRRRSARPGMRDATGTDLDSALDPLRAPGMTVKVDRTTKRDDTPDLHVKVTAAPGSAEQEALRDFAARLAARRPAGESRPSDLLGLPDRLAAAAAPGIPGRVPDGASRNHPLDRAADAEITATQSPRPVGMRARAIGKHGIELHRLDSSEVVRWRHSWIPTTVRRLRQPMPYKHASEVQCVSLDASLAEAVRRAMQ